MRRLAALLLTSSLATTLLATTPLACAHKSDGGQTSLLTETVKEDQAEVVVELLYAAVAPRQVELTLKMRVTGLVETNKLVAEVYIQGFNVEDGYTRWDGFVPPRQPQTYRVVLSIPDGHEEATAKVSLVRSNDSHVLLREELSFAVDAAGAVTLKR